MSQIDEISGSADLQIIMDYSWYDYRFAMDDFWLYADPDAYSGVDLTRLLTNDSIVMWLPEVTFPDAADLSVETAVSALPLPLVPASADPCPCADLDLLLPLSLCLRGCL